MEFDAHVGQTTIPLFDAFNCKISQFTNKSITKYLSSTTTNSRVFDGIINIADETHAVCLGDNDLFGSREILGNHDADVSWDEVKGSSNIEVSGRIRVNCP